MDAYDCDCIALQNQAAVRGLCHRRVLPCQMKWNGKLSSHILTWKLAAILFLPSNLYVCQWWLAQVTRVKKCEDSLLPKICQKVGCLTVFCSGFEKNSGKLLVIFVWASLFGAARLHASKLLERQTAPDSVSNSRNASSLDRINDKSCYNLIGLTLSNFRFRVSCRSGCSCYGLLTLYRGSFIGIQNRVFPQRLGHSVETFGLFHV